MSAGPSLYRRHRPRTFDDVVGQEHVVRTLRNAIERDKVHHAYLFVGSRGTGKTSMAKILAASLNCERGGPTVTPCGECESCVSIADATSLDVLEMDAASNNSVDDIRELREKVAYAPVSGRHKVYILDEAHMLTAQAWNAFLKTLEEPPPHTVFVLATTEANKVLPTVVDRCHRFDFTRPTSDQIAAVLARVAAAEGITIPDEARALIARAATGSFRDALGTLEQLVTYSGTTIELDDVLAVLGAADSDLLFATVDAVASGSAREALLIAGRLASSGRDVGRFFGDLEDHARALMVCQALGGGAVPAELRVTAEHDARLLEQAGRVTRADVIRLLDLIAAALRAMKDGSDPRIQLELALVKAAEPATDHATRALLARLERLEAALAAGAPADVAADRPVQRASGRPDRAPGDVVADRPVQRASGRPHPQPPRAREATTAGPPASVPTRPPAATRAPGQDATTPAALGTPEAIAPAAPEPDATTPAAPGTPEAIAPAAPERDAPAPPAAPPPPAAGAQARPAPASVPAPAPPAAPPPPATPAAGAQARPAPASVPAPAPAVERQGEPEPPSGQVPPPATNAGAAPPSDPQSLWAGALASLQEEEPATVALLQDAKPLAISDNRLTLAWPASQAFSKKRAEAPDCRDLLVGALHAAGGQRLGLEHVLVSDEQLAEEEPEIGEDELVARFVEAFDARELPTEPEGS